jgi:hypothetical protein
VFDVRGRETNTTIDFSTGIKVARELVRNSLVESTEPFLTSSRLATDLRKIKQRLAKGVTKLSADDLKALYPVILLLQGYEVAAEDTLAEHHFWKTQSSDPGGIRLAGLAALLGNAMEMQTYQELLSQQHYVFYLPEKKSVPPDAVPKQVRLMGPDDLVSLLTALAVVEYIDTFVLTISSMPGLREKLQAALAQEVTLSWETITAISQRWSRIVKANKQ